MGRLNYTNRKNEGLKLGQVCAKDLTKRKPGASGFKAALRDPVVELEVQGKCLTDTGFYELAQGLIQTYEANNDQQTILRLEELDLKENILTPKCLSMLSDVIQLARNDLRDLNLSQNEICVHSEQDLTAWERFLHALSNCSVLRHLDLSSNRLGSKAYEVLLRVYSQEKPVDLILPQHVSTIIELAGVADATRSLSVGSGTDDPAGPEDDSTPKNGRKGFRHVAKSPEKSHFPNLELQLSPVYATTKGLRSVPYIVLVNTALDDTSALYLSYIVANHHQPSQLLSRVPPARAGVPAQLLASYDKHSQCRGIIYLPNVQSNAAARVLELAERVRDSGDQTSTQKEHRAHAKSTPNHRKGSPIVNQDVTQTSVIDDLGRARSRLQTNCIEQAGHRCNDLWQIAMKMLSISRNIRARPTKTPQTNAALASTKPRQPVIRTLEIPNFAMAKKPSPWGMPLAPKSTNVSMSPRPKPHKRTPSTAHRSPGYGDEAANQAAAPVPSRPKTEYRSALPCGFSEDVWSRIVGYAVGADGILTSGQQRSILQYGIDKRNLRKEREILGLKESLQIWHVLDNMDCLEYEVR